MSVRSDMSVIILILCTAGLMTRPTKATDGDTSVIQKTTDSKSSIGINQTHETVVTESLKKIFRPREKSSVIVSKSKSSWYKLTNPLALDDSWFAPVSHRVPSEYTSNNAQILKPEGTLKKCPPAAIQVLPLPHYTTTPSHKDPVLPAVDHTIQEYVTLPLTSSPNGSEIHLTKNTILKYDTVRPHIDNERKAPVLPARKYVRFLNPIANEYVDKNEYRLNEHVPLRKVATVEYLPKSIYVNKRKQDSVPTNVAPADNTAHQTIHSADNSNIKLPRMHTVVIRWNLILV